MIGHRVLPDGGRSRESKTIAGSAPRADCPQAARRAAQRTSMRSSRYASPYYWAAFSLEASDEAFNRPAKRLTEGEPVLNLEAHLAGILRQRLEQAVSARIRAREPHAHQACADAIHV